MDTLGHRLKTARQHWKLTQEDLEARSGVQQSDISKLERNEMFKTTSLPALARALRCDADWLDTGHGEPDYGHVLRGWPFPGIERAKFAALTAEQRLEIQGAVRKMISDFETAHQPNGAPTLRAVPGRAEPAIEHLPQPSIRQRIKQKHSKRA